MKHINLKESSDVEFRRVTGVKPATFRKMVEILIEAHKKKKAKGGRPNKLTIEQMLFMTLEYLREYRTYLSIAKNYGLSESNAFQTIKWVEEVLIKSKEFRLPGKKVLAKNDQKYTTVLIDATESPIERPKKNKDNITPEKRKDTPLKHRL